MKKIILSFWLSLIGCALFAQSFTGDHAVQGHGVFGDKVTFICTVSSLREFM